ncbi:ubiquitin C-terminal hydrolase Ubp14, partial [Coemansia guatemalensis]
PGEELLPEDEPADAPASEQQEQQVDEEVVAQLESMGFPRVRCVKAIKKTGNCGAEAAMNWIFEHMEDPDIDAPEPEQQPQQPSAASSSVDPAAVEQLMAMGFPKDRVERALGQTSGDANRALDRLLSSADDDDDDNAAANPESEASRDDSANASKFELTGFVSHKGTSVHCGHYVASIRHGLGDTGKWFLFNDSKVVEQPEPQPEQAYVYFFTRID